MFNHSGTQPFYETISDQVPHLYETISDASSDLPHHYDTIKDSGIYSKGKPTELMRYDWYHGNISEEQAEIAMYGVSNAFLVRHTGSNLILSANINGWKSHDIIHRSPEGYCLEGRSRVFMTVPDMIDFYSNSPIRGGRVLGMTVDKSSKGTYNYSYNNDV